MLALCAERDGLVVSLSRIVAVAARRRISQRGRGRPRSVFGRLLEATRPGATGAALYTVAREAYAEAGFPGEELKHHQGGAIGYRAREWMAHPKSAGSRAGAPGVRLEPDHRRNESRRHRA